MGRIFAALMLVVFGSAACLSVQNSGRSNIYVMRHLQKGSGEDPPLSQLGAANAKQLVRFFKSDPPRAIFVSTTRRARETAAPLAEALGLSPTSYDPRDSAALVARIASTEGTVLVVGHSNTVPEIIARLGGTAPPPLGDADYGDIWKISGRDRKVTRLRLGGS